MKLSPEKIKNLFPPNQFFPTFAQPPFFLLVEPYREYCWLSKGLGVIYIKMFLLADCQVGRGAHPD
jgi:hypothetical protein